MNEDFLLEVGLDLFNEQLNDIYMEYSDVCTTAITEINQAFEVYEAACLLEAYNYVEESSSKSHLQTIFEGAGNSLIDKIVSILKGIINKLREIFGKIKEKLDNFVRAIKSKYPGVGSWEFYVHGRKKNTKPFPNGFKVKFGHGIDCYKIFADANRDMISDVADTMTDFANECIKEKPSGDFDTKYQKVVNTKKVVDTINEYMKGGVKFESNAEEWCKKAFEFEQKGEDWIPSNDEIKEIFEEVNTAALRGTLIDIYSRSVNMNCSRMSDCIKKIERMKDMAAIPRHGEGIKLMAQNMVQFSEFGVVVSTTVIKFITTKQPIQLNWLKSNGFAK